MKSKKELLLISNLRKNSRERLTRISRETNIPISTLFDMLKKTDKIRKHTCIPSYESIGYNIRATMTIKILGEEKERFKKYIMKHPNVNSLFRINNGFDFMVEVICKELKDLESFSEKIEKQFNIKDKEVYYMIDELGDEMFLSEPNKVNLFHS